MFYHDLAARAFNQSVKLRPSEAQGLKSLLLESVQPEGRAPEALYATFKYFNWLS